MLISKTMDDYNSIYPNLPVNSEPSSSFQSVNFRLQKSCEVLQNLEKEIKHYEKVRKKYNRARGIFTKISVSSGVISVILSASGVGTSLTGFGAVVGIPLGAVGGFCGEYQLDSVQLLNDFHIKLVNMNRQFLWQKQK